MTTIPTPVIYVDERGALISRVSAEQVEAVLGPIVDQLRGVDAMDATHWAELHRLREEVKGPDGFATWKDAAVAERLERIRYQRELALITETATSDKENPPTMIARTEIVSKPGAAIEVTKIFLTDAAKLALTAQSTNNDH